MGKASRKLAKKQSKKNEQGGMRELKDKEVLCREQMEQEKYDEALGTLAEIAQTGRKDAEMMYLTAVCYFMTGDYERSAVWINNTLTYAPEHIKVRVLLARLCLLQEREEDALAVFDFVLEHGLDHLSSVEQDEIEEILEYYARNEAEKLQQDYPHIAAFMQLSREQPQKQKLETAPQITVTTLGEAQKEDAPELQKSADEDDWKIKKQSILQKEVSVAEKLRILNAFAGAYYFSKDNLAAQGLLQTALELDAFDEMSLRNMVILQAELGQKDLAAEYAAKLPQTDFQLLRLIREF